MGPLNQPRQLVRWGDKMTTMKLFSACLGLVLPVLLGACTLTNRDDGHATGDETTNQAADLVELGMRHYGMGVKGTASGYLEALELFRKGADQGDASAQFNLGNMYANGQGVPQDFSEAYVWYSLSAANNGPEKATTFRDLNRENLTPDQVAAAQKRAKELFEEIEKKKGSH